VAVHETYLSYLFRDPNWQKFAGAVAIGAGLIIAGRAAAARLRSPEAVSESVVPEEKFSLFAFFDLFVAKLFRKNRVCWTKTHHFGNGNCYIGH